MPIATGSPLMAAQEMKMSATKPNENLIVIMGETMAREKTSSASSPEEDSEVMGKICPLTLIGGKPRTCLEFDCAWYSTGLGGECAMIGIGELKFPDLSKNLDNLAHRINQSRKEIAGLKQR